MFRTDARSRHRKNKGEQREAELLCLWSVAMQMAGSAGRGVPSYVHYIQEAYRPVVMTVASPEVDRLCQKNFVSFTEMLRPLGHELQGVGSMLCCWVWGLVCCLSLVLG